STAASRVYQPAPQRIARRKGFSHHQAKPRVADIAARNLRCEGQELFVDEAFVIKAGQQSRTSFDEDSPAGIYPARFLEDGACGNFTGAFSKRAYLQGIRHLLPEHALQAGRRG